MNKGPPATTVLPAARQRAIKARAESRCAIIPLTNTRSAHARSASCKVATFRSIKRFSHLAGNIAATVNSPSGGRAARLRTNFSACLKLQKVSGNSGYSIKTFFIR